MQIFRFETVTKIYSDLGRCSCAMYFFHDAGLLWHGGNSGDAADRICTGRIF